MVGMTPLLMGMILVGLGLIALLIAKPSVTATRGGKILAFVSFLIFPVLAGLTGTAEHLEFSKSTQFCLSCHVMEDYGKSLRVDDRSFIPAVHYQNHLVPRDKACFTCHTDYAMYGDLRAKLRGLKHVYVYYLGTPPDPIKLYTPYQNRECLHCHLGARSFEEGATHNQEPGLLERVKSGQQSCLTSGCHNITHDVKGLKDVKLWEGGSR